jgi:phosphoribosyl-dephospho-CoA transferase
MGLTELRVHDLLQVPSPDAVEVVDPPLWLAGALAAAPWVVVRRAPPRHGRIAVGIRGTTRDQRCAAYLDPAHIRQRVAPEDLVVRAAWETAPRRAQPVLVELARRAPAFNATGLAWGIAGGAGFELATGMPVLSDSSDLDLILRGAPPLAEVTLAAFAALAGEAACRIDVLVETPAGGFSLAEYVGTSDTLLLRQPDGARLIARARLRAGVAP